MTAFYNDTDPFAAQWTRNLIAAGELPPGHVDERSIADVTADLLAPHAQTHLFSGIGGWPLALRYAGWPESCPVWTCSTPCPPFSSAGKKKRCPVCGGAHPIPCPRRTGYFICSECEHAWHADARHLWPEALRLIRDARPAIVFGEQVSGKDGLVWYAGVRTSLERIGYSVGAVDIPAAGAGEDGEGWVVRGDQGGWERIGIGAPHIRQRIYWVAIAEECRAPDEFRSGESFPKRRGCADGLAVAGSGELRDDGCGSPECAPAGVQGPAWEQREIPNRGSGAWSACAVILCRDNKYRRVPADAQPEILGVADGLSAHLGRACPVRYPLATKTPRRVGRLKGCGNAIVVPLAARFVGIVMEILGIAPEWEVA